MNKNLIGPQAEDAIETVTYYLVAVRLTPEKSAGKQGNSVYWGFNNPHWEWLAIEQGYSSHTANKRWAYRFESPPSYDQIRQYSGFPWYCKHDLRVKPRIIKVTETHTRDETLVT